MYVPTACMNQVSETEQKRISRKRKFRTGFSEYQLSEMKKRFKSDPYIKGMEKELMAKNLGISLSSLSNWFYRQRCLKQKLGTKKAKEH